MPGQSSNVYFLFPILTDLKVSDGLKYFRIKTDLAPLLSEVTKRKSELSQFENSIKTRKTELDTYQAQIDKVSKDLRSEFITILHLPFFSKLCWKIVTIQVQVQSPKSNGLGVTLFCCATTHHISACATPYLRLCPHKLFSATKHPIELKFSQ